MKKPAKKVPKLPSTTLFMNLVAKQLYLLLRVKVFDFYVINYVSWWLSLALFIDVASRL